MEFITIEGAKPNGGHYSPATEKGNFVFISGQLPVNPFTGEKCQGDIVSQTKQVLENLDTVLEAAGTSKENIMKVTLFISDISHWDTVNEVYKQYFGDHKPARSIVPTKELHFGFEIELEAIAYKDEKE
ncbi:RidA family protein [Ureibacillus manganicus]|uniref:Endoribonuclease L-PSP n=1 Tax=Ureibacillus manganicus DSM 26584 TaxID=1384049 RepID=A0A0A3IAR9_9BACL|nr:Rid family detoxifying hydrolase [Ureibacillus manganicus]KGR79913.1 endoribonuclease L-PSP [Ureibacillus manganicus DSM 26584]